MRRCKVRNCFLFADAWGTVSARRLINGGGRIEKTDGRVVSVLTPIGGVYDTASPPDGWVRKGARPGMRWNLDYVAAGDRLRYELEATVFGAQLMRVEGTDLTAMEIRYEGLLYTSFGSGSMPPTASRIATKLWYAPSLARLVRFEARGTRPQYGLTDENTGAGAGASVGLRLLECAQARGSMCLSRPRTA